MSPKDNTGTIYDMKIQNIFEDWIIESGLKIKFNVVTYFIEIKKERKSFLQWVGLNPPTEKKILHILTNRPDTLIGTGNPNLLERYKEHFKKEIDIINDVIISEVKDQERILRGVKKKLKMG